MKNGTKLDEVDSIQSVETKSFNAYNKSQQLTKAKINTLKDSEVKSKFMDYLFSGDSDIENPLENVKIVQSEIK